MNFNQIAKSCEEDVDRAINSKDPARIEIAQSEVMSLIEKHFFAPIDLDTCSMKLRDLYERERSSSKFVNYYRRLAVIYDGLTESHESEIPSYLSPFYSASIQLLRFEQSEGQNYERMARIAQNNGVFQRHAWLSERDYLERLAMRSFAFRSLGRFSDAEKTLASYTVSPSGGPIESCLFMLERGEFNWQQGRFREALEIAEALLQRLPDERDNINCRLLSEHLQGRALLGLKRYREARKVFLVASQQPRQHLPLNRIRLSLATLEIFTGHPSRALEEVEIVDSEARGTVWKQVGVWMSLERMIIAIHLRDSRLFSTAKRAMEDYEAQSRTNPRLSAYFHIWRAFGEARLNGAKIDAAALAADLKYCQTFHFPDQMTLWYLGSYHVQ